MPKNNPFNKKSFRNAFKDVRQELEGLIQKRAGASATDMVPGGGKMRKRILLACGVVIVALACLLLTGAKPAQAQSVEWVRVVRSNAYIYIKDNSAKSNRLFKPPEGYYLRVTEERGCYYGVVVYDTVTPIYFVKGYVLKEDVSPQTSVALPVYPKLTARVDEYFTSPEAERALPAGGEAVYYGEYGDGLLYYVRIGSVFGYVQAEKVNFFVEKHPFQLEEQKDDSLTDKIESFVQNDNNSVAIAILVGVALTFGILLTWSLSKKA